MDDVNKYAEMAQSLALDYGPKVVAAILIFLIGKWLSGILARVVGRAMTRARTDAMLVKFVENLVYAGLLAFVVLAVLAQLGIQTTSFIAVIGAAGLAIGLALQGSLSNFAAGVMLIIFRPFGKGDFVEVAGTSGKVDEVRIFNTILTTPDNKQITLPNALITAEPITNYSALDKRRVDLVIGVGYDDDLKVARDVLIRICKEHDKVLDDPETQVWVSELGDSSVNFNVRPWARTDDYWAVYGDLLETAKVELEAAGCSIPYPQRDIHLHKTDD